MKLQLTIASFTICLLFFPMLRAQESPRIVSYDLTVQIDVPNRQVEVGGSFEVDFQDSDSISLVLWRHARIDTLRHSSREITYRFDTLAPAPAQFIPDGRTLTLYRPAGADDRCRINTRYTLYMQEVQGPAKSFNVKLLKLYLAIENTLYLCIKDKINNEKSYRLYSCFY